MACPYFRVSALLKRDILLRSDFGNFHMLATGEEVSK
jgi:hypothetical protein